MILKEMYPILSNTTCNFIIDETLREIQTGKTSPFSYQTIYAEGRKPALAARMSSQPLIWEEAIINNNAIESTGNFKKYFGKDIADIYVTSVKNNAIGYYPITGTLPKQNGLEQLILFVKGANGYYPYAKFDITDILHQTEITPAQASNLVDITPITNSKFSTILEIKNVVTDGLPQNYLGNASTQSIYDKAFKGAAPVIICI